MISFIPPCRLCGERHRLGPCPESSDAAPRAPERSGTGVQAPQEAQEEAAAAPAEDAGHPLEKATDEEVRAEYRKRFFAMRDAKRPKDEPRRKVYMREYMRAHRAK